MTVIDISANELLPKKLQVKVSWNDSNFLQLGSYLHCFVHTSYQL